MKRATIAAFSPKHSGGYYGIRSISLPTRSHPSTLRIQEELNKLKAWEASSSCEVERILFGLSGLVELHKCIQNLLKLPLTQQALSHYHNQKWVDELLESPVRFLDILGETRDAIMLMKGNVGELQSALRRRKVGDLVIESYVYAYWSVRRNTRKQCTKSMLLLKQKDGSFGASALLDLNHHLSAVVRVLREASFITGSIFQSLLAFLSSPILKSKLNKWAFVSRLMKKGVLIQCNNQEENVNELEKVDLALCRMVMDNSNKDFEAENIQSAHKELEAVVVVIEGLENVMDCLFNHLINTRVSFLNIISPSDRI